MRKRMNLNFKFHPVGFGLFTSGKIGNFRFVYDCGSKTTEKVKTCLTDEFMQDEPLDLLAISHFHKDHISGIKELLNRVGVVKTIVLPYFSPRERLVYILSLYSDTDEPVPDAWLLEFITDPINYLLENFDEKIKNIILIKGGREYFENESKEILMDKFTNDDSVFIAIDLNNLNNSKDEFEIKLNEGITSKKVSVKESGSLKLTNLFNIPIWQFIFYSPELSEKQKEYFRKISIRALTDFEDPHTKTALFDIVSKDDFVNSAKKSGVNNNDINNTSLLLFHSPISTIETRVGLLKLYSENMFFNCFCEGSPFNDSYCGFLFTGDINLKKYYISINAYYGKLLDRVCIYQIPHHGSKDNWESSISKRNHGSFHIASSKLSNTRKLHPNPNVLYEIAINKGLFIWCNEDNGIVFKGNIWI